jgi:Tol biopolymer transport system component
MATGALPFRGDTSGVIFDAILNRDPVAPVRLNPDLAPKLEEIINRALEKDRNLRFQHASDLHAELQRVKRDSSSARLPVSAAHQTEREQVESRSPSEKITTSSFRRLGYYIVPTFLVLAAVAGYLLYRSSHSPPAVSKEWEQLTFFTDSAVYPELSPDGRMLAFIRGNNSFFGPGQIYVKFLPDGQPVQLTHDATNKLSPAFSPDGSLIAYGIFGPVNVMEVPILGGEPRMLLPNASSLTWIQGGKRLLYSEIKEGLHLVVVTSDESRGNSRDVYTPPGQRSMAHHSYLSPDGRWVLIVEMDNRGEVGPCRVVPFQGAGESRVVGPPNSPCFAGAWSKDGKWVYLSVRTDDSHIWRQRVPSGQPQQITFGPTSQEGIAMAPDGKSFITAVGSQDSTVWIHDKDGEKQVSSEGYAGRPSFSSDGTALYFLMVSGQSQVVELWVKDLIGGKMDKVLPGYSMANYSVSRDGKQVAFAASDAPGHASLRIAPMNRRSSPVRISSTEIEDSPFFLPDGDLIFRVVENGSNFLYRMKPDGSGRRKITPERILDVHSVAPDGHWILASAPNPGEEQTTATKAFSVDGTKAVKVCLGYCQLVWDPDGKFAYLFFPALSDKTYAIPIVTQSGLPSLPPNGVAGLEDLKTAKSVVTVPNFTESAISPSFYATRVKIRDAISIGFSCSSPGGRN